jgi:Ser-tRNA(Ala) deacylase AlaX
MASIKVNTLQDKAAFLNHLMKFGINTDSFDIQDVKADVDANSYFVINNVSDDIASDVKDMFKGNNKVNVMVSKSDTIKEVLRRIIREEYRKKLGK